MRPAKDDPRLSRGLQLLQNKIAILEDLSDRTDAQVKELCLILEEKSKNVKTTMEGAKNQIAEINVSMRKSREIAKIFEDRIPHEEIVDRQNTIKYVKAAQLAHQGRPVDEIEKVVGLPRSELEMIVKMNRDRLLFNVEAIPDWAKNEISEETFVESSMDPAVGLALEPPVEPKGESSFIPADADTTITAPNMKTIRAENAKNIRPYQFPRVTLNKLDKFRGETKS